MKTWFSEFVTAGNVSKLAELMVSNGSQFRARCRAVFVYNNALIRLCVLGHKLRALRCRGRKLEGCGAALRFCAFVGVCLRLRLLVGSERVRVGVVECSALCARGLFVCLSVCLGWRVVACLRGVLARAVCLGPGFGVSGFVSVGFWSVLVLFCALLGFRSSGVFGESAVGQRQARKPHRHNGLPEGCSEPCANKAIEANKFSVLRGTQALRFTLKRVSCVAD